MVSFILMVLISACSHLKQAHEYYDQGSYSQVVRLCREAIRADSSDTQAYFLMGNALEELDSLQAAEEAFTACVQQYPDNMNYRQSVNCVLLKRARTAKQDSNYYDALNMIERAERFHTDSTRQVALKADVLRDMGKHDQAVKLYHVLLTFKKDSIPILRILDDLQTRKERAEQWFEKGNQYQSKRRFEAAIDHYEKALTSKPDFEEAQYELYITKGRLYYRMGSSEDLWESIMQFGYAANIHPERAEPHYYMGFAYHKKDRKEYDNAIQAFEKAADLQPDSEIGQKAVNKVRELRAHQKKMQEFWSH
ncbi:MAG: tetratricopeptide repeat protein [candidate division KSB1 bacterium]|nr:tetratricopeptide repeat protein [candidate division KSB1 bacterium]